MAGSCNRSSATVSSPCAFSASGGALPGMTRTECTVRVRSAKSASLSNRPCLSLVEPMPPPILTPAPAVAPSERDFML